MLIFGRTSLALWPIWPDCPDWPYCPIGQTADLRPGQSPLYREERDSLFSIKEEFGILPGCQTARLSQSHTESFNFLNFFNFINFFNFRQDPSGPLPRLAILPDWPRRPDQSDWPDRNNLNDRCTSCLPIAIEYYTHFYE